MTHLPMLENILGQVRSLEGVLDQHTGAAQRDLVACGRLIAQASGTLIVTGMGASFFAALPAVQVFEKHGVRVRHAESAELLHYGEGSWKREDVALLISRSGGSIEVLELARKMKRTGTRLIAVTNLPDSKLAELADETLFIGSAPDELIAVQTYTGTVLALLLLAEQAVTLGGNLATQTAATLPLLDDLIDRSLERSETWQTFFTGAEPLYLLGRGSSLATIAEGALLFHETAKAATVAMSSGQFRHGPVEVVSADFRALIVGSSAPTASLDWKLASDLRAMNASVRWIGPMPKGEKDGVLPLLEWPTSIPPALSPIFDMIPLQVAAYRTALWRGVQPGDFRYASEVTANESGFPFFEARLA